MESKKEREDRKKKKLPLSPNIIHDDNWFKVRGDCDIMVSDTGLVFVKWLDTKLVHFLSTYHGTDMK